MGEAPKPAAHPAVLVVEDEEALRQLVAAFLSRHGIQVFQAGDAAEALSRVRQLGGAIDLAIIDMVMPGTSGLDVATDLIREYPAIRILYVSGYGGSIAMDGIARRSPDAVLLKPFSEPMLLERVERLLDMRPGAGADTGSA